MAALSSDRPTTGTLLVGVYLVFSVLMAVVSGPAWKLALAGELLVVAWLARKERLGNRARWALATLGLGRFVVGAVLGALAHPLSAALEGMTLEQWMNFVNVRMLTAAVQVLWSLTPAGVIFVVLFALTSMPALRERGRGGWPAFAAVGCVIPLLGLIEPVDDGPSRTFDQAGLEAMVGLHDVSLDSEGFSPRTRPSALPVEGQPQRVVLVVLESVGNRNIQAHLERHPEGAWAELLGKGLFFDRVLSVANVSHMAQPALLTSQEYSRGVHVRSPRTPTPPPPAWGFAEHFAAKGWHTVMRSSQEESWLGMGAITLSEAWADVRHASDAERPEDTYVDACGTRKVYDSVTIRQFEQAFGAATGPAFGYLNLQNTHFSYVVEDDVDPVGVEGLVCKDLSNLPPWKLPLAIRRYNDALDDTLDALSALISRTPETLFIVTGDHGESMLPEKNFAHAHDPAPDQMETFALFVGPGVDAGRKTTLISTLDLLPTTIATVSAADAALLPPDMLQGINARVAQDSPRVFFSLSCGLQPTSYAVATDDLWLRTSTDERSCEDRGGAHLPIERCEHLRSALAYWLSCKTKFYAQEGQRQWYEPCWRLAQEHYLRAERG